MEKFQIDLKNCSAKERNKLITFLRAHGIEWYVKDTPKKWLCIESFFFGAKGERKPCMVYRNSIPEIGILFSMPADYEAIKGHVKGEEVKPKEEAEKVKPKDGEIWVFGMTGQWNGVEYMYRSKGGSNNGFYSRFCDNKFELNCVFNWTKNEMINHHKATPKEEADYIDTEHENGYHWTGKELVKIPEYVEIISSKSINKLWYKNRINEIFQVGKFSDGYAIADWCYEVIGKCGVFGGVLFEHTKPSTKAAYEAQEAKKAEKKEAETPSFAYYERTIKKLEDKNKLLEACNADNVKKIADLSRKLETEKCRNNKLIAGVEDLEKRIENLSECKGDLDNVTVERLQKVLYSCGMFIAPEILDRIIDAVELIEAKGDGVSLMDIAKMESDWKNE